MSVSLSRAPVISPPESVAQANIALVHQFVGEFFHNAFPHLTPLQLQVTVDGFFCLDQNVKGLENHLQDVLVQIKVFLFY